MSWGEAQPSQYDSGNPYGTPQPPPQQPPQQFDWPVAPPQQPQFPQPFGFGEPPQQPFADEGRSAPKKRRGLLIGVVAGAVVVIGGGVTAALLLTGKHGAAGHTDTAAVALSTPGDIKGLTLMTGTRAEAAVSTMKQSLASQPAQYPDPLLAAYSDHAANSLTTVLIDEPTAELSADERAQLTSLGSARQIVATIMSGVGATDPQTEPTGAADGALSCGRANESGTEVTVCVWYDGTTFGSLQYLDGTSPSVAAPVADAVRAAAEG